MKLNTLKNVLIANTFFFLISFFFLNFPKFDIWFSELFFYEDKFISEKFVFIKSIRSFLKDLMVIISITSLLILLINIIYKKKIIKTRI